MNTNENKVKLFQKLLTIQKSVMGLGKDRNTKSQYNPNGYEYVTGTKILSIVKPLMNELGLILKQEIITISNQRQDYTTTKGSKSEILTTLQMKFTWVDVETGEADENMFAANGQNDWEKGAGSAMTYAERYFLLKYFHIATDEDDIDNPDRKPMIVESTKAEPVEPVKKAPTKAKEVKEEEPKSAIQPNQNFDTKEEQTEEQVRKAKAKIAFDGLDKPTVLKHLISVRKFKYTSIDSFLEGENIDTIMEIYQELTK